MTINRRRPAPAHGLEVARVVHAPAETVWDILVDTARWVEWGPSVRAVRCSQRRIEPGSRGSVQTALGFWLPFVVTDFVPGVYWAWKVASIRATGHRVRPLGAGVCELIFEIPALAAPYALICRIAANRIARLAAAGPP